jgi:electron transfer flavoprotein alpha subunit
MHAVRRAAQRSFSSRRHASTLIVAEHDGVKLTESTLAAITACAAMKPITLLIGGSACKSAAEAAGKASGVDSVAYVEAPSLDHGVAEEWAPLVVDLAKKGGYTHIASERLTLQPAKRQHTRLYGAMRGARPEPPCWARSQYAP